MDLTISKSELTKILYLSQGVVERRTTKPILSYILLSAGEGRLRISASDLEVTTVSSAEARISSGGSTAVNAKLFGDIVKELPDTDVQLKLADGERLEIRAKNSKWKVIGKPAEEYPSLPGMSLEVKNKVSAVQLLEMINKTSYAVSPDDTRINLNGLCIELAKETQGTAKGKSKERSMRFVATDGHRLAMVTRPIAGLSFDGNALVSRKAVGEIRKMLEMIGDREVGIDIAERFLILEGQGNKIAIVLMDAEFPDYNQVLPKQKGKIAVMKSGELAQALRRVALMVTDKGKCVKFDFSKDLLRISSSSPELGEASEELAINYKGDQLSAGFNAKYIIDITSSLTEDQPLVMELNGELGAGKFYPENDESYTAIVMPMRLT